MEDLDKGKIIKEWCKLRTEHVSKKNRLKVLADRYETTQKSIRDHVNDAGVWLDSAPGPGDLERVKENAARYWELVERQKEEESQREYDFRGLQRELKGSYLERSLQFWGCALIGFLILAAIVTIIGEVFS